MCFLYTAEGWILFHIHSLSLCLFIGELSPLKLSDINDQWLLIPNTFWWQQLCASLFWVFHMGSCLFPVFLWVQIASLGWGFPSSTFCRAGFVDTYCLNLVLSWNILFSPLMVIESFAGYSSLGLLLQSLSVCNTSVQDFWISQFPLRSWV